MMIAVVVVVVMMVLMTMIMMMIMMIVMMMIVMIMMIVIMMIVIMMMMVMMMMVILSCPSNSVVRVAACHIKEHGLESQERWGGGGECKVESLEKTLYSHFLTILVCNMST